jgi:Glycosyl transferase 4-like domain
MMRVARVGNYRRESANGIEKSLAGSVSRLPLYGVQIEIWHFTTTVTHMREYKIDGIHVFDLPVYGRPLNFLRSLTPAARLFVQRRQRTVDLVHFHSVFIPEHVWLAPDLRVPYILTPNGGYSMQVLRGRHRWFKAV